MGTGPTDVEFRDDLSIVIPTYGRETVMVNTLSALLSQRVQAREIILVDQTLEHDAATWQALSEWMQSGQVRRIHFSPPSIPRAMNIGLLQAVTPYVLFLDDDIVPGDELIAAHLAARLDIAGDDVWCVVGQVLQPGEVPIDPATWTHRWFPFHGNQRQLARDVMAGNLCVDRKCALKVGGFDENFVGSAFGFESEFARRILSAGGKILFEPNAGIRHLRASRGGTRSYGHHLTTWRPHHAVGIYYSAFRRGWWPTLKTLAIQPLRSIRTKHHLRAPWWIPVTLFAEALGAVWAMVLASKGPKFISSAVANEVMSFGKQVSKAPEIAPVDPKVKRDD